jgi:hypothetical protein
MKNYVILPKNSKKYEKLNFGSGSIIFSKSVSFSVRLSLAFNADKVKRVVEFECKLSISISRSDSELGLGGGGVEGE